MVETEAQKVYIRKLVRKLARDRLDAPDSGSDIEEGLAGEPDISADDESVAQECESDDFVEESCIDEGDEGKEDEEKS